MLAPAAPAPITEKPLDLAERCDLAKCELPYCFCSKDGTSIPGDLEPENVSSWWFVLLVAGACYCTLC